MPSFNHVTLLGNVTRDPEIRYIASGSGVTKFTLAVNRKTKQGDETMYVDVVAWDKLGEICNQYLKKGQPVLIDGRLAIRKYDDKDGVKRTAVEIVANEMQMLGNSGGRRDNGGSYASSSRAPSNNQTPLQDALGLDEEEFEVPF